MYYIYRITNSINGKVYIGQTIQPVEKRYRCHIYSAMNNTMDTHLARAIRKYGPSAFTCTVIDTADNEPELLEKEQKWIKEYDSMKNGYNETDASYKCGGNTFMSKSAQDMKVIIEKLRVAKLGGKNPSARSVTRVNVLTGERDEFDSITECARACGINSGKSSLTIRLNNHEARPLHGVWMFYFNNKKSVSTIPDECKGVGSEIGTEPKRKTAKADDMVSTSGDRGLYVQNNAGQRSPRPRL